MHATATQTTININSTKSPAMAIRGFTAAYVKLTLIILLTTLMTACRAGTSRHTSLAENPPPLIKEQTIRTYAQYAKALEKERSAYLEAMQTDDAKKEKPAVFVVRELGKLPSAASRKYAAALAEVLKRHGLPTPPQPNITAGTKTITYEELAKVTALTSLLDGPKYSWNVDMPAPIWRDIARVVVTHCPSDDAALLVMVPALCEVLENIADSDSAVRLECKKMAQQALQRILDEKRPMNLIKVGMAIGLLSGGEFWCMYSFVIDNPNGRDFQNLIDATIKAAERAAQYAQHELPEELQERYNEFMHEKPDDLKAFAREWDEQLMKIYPATIVMKAFCDAVNRRDEKTVWEFAADAHVVTTHGYVTVEDAIKNRKVLENVFVAILGEEYDQITFDYVGYMYLNTGWRMRAVLSGPNGSEGVKFGLKLTEDGKSWKVAYVNRSEKRKSSD